LLQTGGRAAAEALFPAAVTLFPDLFLSFFWMQDTVWMVGFLPPWTMSAQSQGKPALQYILTEGSELVLIYLDVPNPPRTHGNAGSVWIFVIENP
jgi:hypothetical protein